MPKLSDHQQSIILTAAQPLALPLRQSFMKAVFQRLEGLTEIGDGTVARTCRELQREFFDPPNLQKGNIPERRAGR
jgi:hypothetical protein